MKKMNKDTVEGKWEKLPNDRLDAIAAKRDQLEDEIQQAYRRVKDAAGKQVKAFAAITKH